MKLSWLAAAVAAIVLPSAGAIKSEPVPFTTPKPGTALWTDIVTSCSPEPKIKVNAFNIAFHKANQSISFLLSMDSAIKRLNWRAELHVNAYDVFNQTYTIDTCTLMNNEGLCKINTNIVPNISLSGFGSTDLPGDMKGKIPKIAWMVPDIDAFATVKLINMDDNSVAACLHTTLTSGYTAEIPAIKWLTGAITLVAFLLAVAQSIRKRSSSPALYRWYDLLGVFQNAAVSGCMNLRTPAVWLAFTRNFNWSMGLMYIKSMQDMINRYRASGGGKMPYTTVLKNITSIPKEISGGKGVNLSEAFKNQTEAINLLYSSMIQNIGTWQIPSKVAEDIVSGLVNNPDDLNKILIENGAILANQTVKIGRRALEAPPPGVQETTSVQAGVEQYINAQGIPTANAMSTLFFWLLIFLSILIAFHVAMAIPVVFLKIFRHKTPKWSKHLRRTWWQFCAANFFRFCLAFSFPVIMWGFLQWKIGKKDAIAPIIVSVIAWLIVMVPLIVVFIVSLVKNSNNYSEAHPNTPFIWTDYRFFHAAGVLFRPYKTHEHYFWFSPVLVGMVTKSGFVIFGASNQWSQVIGTMAVEVLTLLNILIFRPYRGAWNNILAFIVCFFHLAMYGLNVAYIPSIKASGVIRTVCGVAQIAMVALPALILIIDSIFNIIYDLCHFKRRFDDFEDLDSPYDDENPDDESVKVGLVKGDSIKRITSPLQMDELKGGDKRYVALAPSPAGPLHDPFQNDPYDYSPGKIYETTHSAPSYNHGYTDDGYGGGGGGNQRVSSHAV